MIYELQAFCAGDLTGREQLTVKVDYDQNKNICVFNGSAETLCCCEVYFPFFYFYFLFVMH